MPSLNISSIGIIGGGKFGNLLEIAFKQYFPSLQIKMFSRKATLDNKTYYSLAEVCTSDLVIPAVAISAFAEVIQSIAKLISKQTIILDVCSVKVYPKKIMLENLPEQTQIICSHPNFGPESYGLNGNSFNGFNIIIENVSASQLNYLEVSSLFKQMGINLVEMPAEMHDQQIGVAHFVSMFQGILINRLNLKAPNTVAASTQKMFDMAKGVGNDFGILLDIYKYNPYVKDMLQSMNLTIKQMQEELLNIANK